MTPLCCLLPPSSSPLLQEVPPVVVVINLAGSCDEQKEPESAVGGTNTFGRDLQIRADEERGTRNPLEYLPLHFINE